MGQYFRSMMLALMSAVMFVPAFAAPLSAAAEPPSFPPYPASTRLADLRDWVARQTDVQLGDVVIMSGGAVYAMPPSAENGVSAGTIVRYVREEAVGAALAARLGGRSSDAILSFDCAHQQSSVTRARVFAGNNLGGGPERPITGGAWLRASTVDLFDLAQAVCDPAFHRPFAGASERPAQNAPPQNTKPENAQPENAKPQNSEPEPPAHAAAASATPPVVASSPSRPAAGRFWVQVGAFASPELAEARWNEVRSSLSLATTAGHRLEPAPGGALTRLLVGPFSAQAAAGEACKALRSSGIDCFVRRP